MHKSWLMCVLLGTLAWGQAAPGTPPPAQTGQAPAPGAPMKMDGQMPGAPGARAPIPPRRFRQTPP